MAKFRAGAATAAVVLLWAGACEPDRQEAQKFERADAEHFRRDMSPMTSFTLANGVTVYVQEERTDNRVAVEVLYRAGFTTEPKGQPQISHVTEHASIYCGIGEFGPDQSIEAIQRDRGMINAEAVADFVHIDYVVAGTRLEEIFQIESDRLRGIRCDAKTMDREITKVIGEIDRSVRDTKGVFTKFAMIALNQAYRFGARHVPMRARVAEYDVADVHRFHDQHYRPDDMILVVIGNIKTADVEALARKYFEPIARSTAPAIPAPALSRSMDATWDIEAEAVYLLAPGPYASTRDRLVLTMFGSFLHQSMNTSPHVYGATSEVYCTNQIYRVADLPFFIYALPARDRKTADVSAILRTHLDSAVAMLQDAALVENIKGNIVSFVTASMLKPDVPDYPLGHHQVIGQEALNVGMKHLLREGRSQDEFVAEVNSVTGDELRATVARYLSSDKLWQVTFAPPR